MLADILQIMNGKKVILTYLVTLLYDVFGAIWRFHNLPILRFGKGAMKKSLDVKSPNKISPTVEKSYKSSKF